MTNNGIASDFAKNGKMLYGNFDIVLGRLSRISRLYTTPHAPCGHGLLSYRAYRMLMWCLQSDVMTDSRRVFRSDESPLYLHQDNGYWNRTMTSYWPQVFPFETVLF